MATTAKEKLSKLREHNTALYKGDKVGSMKKTEVTEAYQENIESFAKEVVETRKGDIRDRFDRKLPAYDISLPEAITEHFGVVAPDRDMAGMPLNRKQQDLYVLKTFFKQNEVYFGSDTLETVGRRFGHSGLNVAGLTKAMLEHSQFDAVNNVGGINPDFRFIIPELIMAAIRLDYQGASMSQNWVSSTVNISERKLKMPQIRRGNTIPRVIGEAESIPFGSVAFGQKEATVFKIGIGFKITDELVNDSTLDMVFEFLGEVGVDMAISKDYNASIVLLNGEQASNLESAPVIGVDSTTNGFAFKDLKRGISRLLRLKRNVNRILTSEDDGITLSLLPEFRGFAGDKTLANLQTLLGVPSTLINDVFVLPSNQLMLLAPDSAMFQLQYRGMTTEERRNPQTQENEIFVSDHVGFAIKRRDGRLLIDKSLAWGSPDNATFPSYMDVDSRIRQAFKTFQTP